MSMSFRTINNIRGLYCDFCNKKMQICKSKYCCKMHCYNKECDNKHIEWTGKIEHHNIHKFNKLCKEIGG